MIAILSYDPWTFATGVAAAICLTSAPAFRTRDAVLTMQLGASLCIVAHYLYLGVSVAAAMNVLGGLQTLAAIFAGQSRILNRFGYALICLMVLSGFLFWQGPLSSISVLAMALIALARMQIDQVLMRLLLLAGGIAWIAHDLLANAWLPLVADIGAVSTGLIALIAMFFRNRIEWRFPQRTPSPRSA